MASFQPLCPEKVRQAISKRIEVNRSVVVIEEERIVESGRLAREAQILFVFQNAVENQIGQDSLLLLPPGFPVMPHKAEVFAIRLKNALDNVVPAAALPVRTGLRHQLSDSPRQSRVFGLLLQRVHPNE